MSSINIPDDVLIEILARLPVKSLIKFKCVCKSWTALVEDGSFITKHHETQAALNDNGCILVKRGHDGSHFDIFSLLYSKGSAVSCVDIDLPFIGEKKTTRFVLLIGPCNGLFCATHKQSYDITIWNPATREFKLLPSSPVSRSPPKYSLWASIGFGFDSKTSDYKVVRIWNVNGHGEGKGFISKVEVWNLSDNSWRQIDAVPPVLLSSITTDYVYRNGKFYWHGAYKRPEMIVSFDMSDEVFKGIALPDRCIRTGAAFWNSISKLNESIVLCSNPIRIKGCIYLDITMMNEIGEHISWNHYMSVKIPKEEWGNPYGFWKNGEMIINDGYRMMLSYDHPTKKFKNFGVYVCSRQRAMIYNESLVSIK